MHAHICTQNKEDILTLKLILEVGIWPSGRVLAQQMQVPGFRSQFCFGFFFFFKKICFLIIRGNRGRKVVYGYLVLVLFIAEIRVQEVSGLTLFR